MLRVELTAAETGMILALPVRNPRDREKVLLRIGYKLNTSTITRLTELGIKTVWIRCPSLDILSKFFNEDIIESQAKIVGQITETFEYLQDHINAKLPYRAYRKSIRDLIHHLIRNPRAAIFLDSMAEKESDRLIAHSSSVTYLSLLMGLKLEGYLVRQRKRINPVIAKEVMAMGLGAMLHDVGVTQLPEGVYKHYLETGDNSDPQWREHPSIGYQMVRGDIEPSASTVVLNHHQCFDGSGYAGASIPVLDGERIHVFARIVALADQFERLLNPPHQPPRPAVAALGEILTQPMARRFDPHAMRALISVMPPYPPGAAVRLSDGRCGICIDHFPIDPCRPVVQLVPNINRIDTNEASPGETIDLRDCDESVFVVECDGQDVSTLNFPPPALLQGHVAGIIRNTKKGRVGLL